MKTTLCGVMAATLALSAAIATAQMADTRSETSGQKMTPMAPGVADVTNAVPDISLADLKLAIAGKAVTLLDCNGSKSYASGHIPGAIDFESAKADLATKLPADKAALVVAYCGGLKCLAYKAGAAAAVKLGYTNVKHFPGGISGWKDVGEKCETADMMK